MMFLVNLHQPNMLSASAGVVPDLGSGCLLSAVNEQMLSRMIENGAVVVEIIGVIVLCFRFSVIVVGLNFSST
jgi:hypothetical protein